MMLASVLSPTKPSTPAILGVSSVLVSVKVVGVFGTSLTLTTIGSLALSTPAAVISDT